MNVSGYLLEPALLYVRQAGDSSSNAKRRLVGELPKSAFCVPLHSDLATFDFATVDQTAAAPSIKDMAPDALSLEAWVLALSRFACFAEHIEKPQILADAKEYALEHGVPVTADAPLWLVANSRCLTASEVGHDTSLVRALPILNPLRVSSAVDEIVGCYTTEAVLDLFGMDLIREAADHLATVIALWNIDQDATAVDPDASQLDEAYQRLDSVTHQAYTSDFAAEKQDPLIAVLQVVFQHENITLKAPDVSESALQFDQYLARVAMLSNFRFREVSLDGSWWQEEGPPLLLLKRNTSEPCAALWRRGQYRLWDPQGHTFTEIHGDAISKAYMLYPGFEDNLTPSVIGRFALRGVTGDVWALLVAGLVATLIGLLVPVATGVIVAAAIPDGRLSLLNQMGLLVGAGAIGTAGFTIGRSLSSVRISTHIDLRLQSAVWDRILRLQPSFFRRFATGDLARRVLAVDAARRLLTGPVLNSLLTGLFASLSFALMLFYDWRLALYGFGFAMAATLTVSFLARRQLAFLAAYRDAQGRVISQVIDTLAGIEKLRLAAAEERFFALWSKDFSVQQRAKWQAGRLRAGLLVLTALLPSLGILGVFVVSVTRASPIDLASFAAFNVAFGQFLNAVMTVGLSLSSVLEVVPLIKRAQPILDAYPEVDEAQVDPGRLSGRLEVNDLSFRYGEDRPWVLDGISFSINPGDLVAFVGQSGSGKSTMLKLLLGFETPQLGSILYDDQDLADLDLRLLRQQIGTVLQSVGLLPGSLYDNIAGAADVSDEVVMEAAERAGLADDIASFPMGLETYVSGDASTLSGGQTQRVMIARALIKKPPILYFDEATSALDNRTQAIVTESLDALQVTRIVIAHRLSTIKEADTILVFDKGRIVESGRYEELLANRGKFFSLVERQIL
ncbi:MAG: NHLP bacteriocin export ABC transporter permease/ATPase subunit [Pseudomonadota bacterium]